MRDVQDIETISHLTEEVAVLKEKITLLTGSESDHHLLRSKGFSPRAARMLVFLANRFPNTCSRESIRSALGSEDCSLQAINLLVHNTRSMLKARGVKGQVETVHSEGYRVDTELMVWIKTVIEPPDSQLSLKL